MSADQTSHVPANAPGPIIALDNVHFSYPGDAREALRGITLQIPRGEHVCFLGSNGSGKSTLAQLVNALLLPTKGRVRVFGLDSSEVGNALAIRRQAAMVFQHPEDQMVTSIVADDVAFGPENLGIPQPEIAQRVNDALAAVGMGDRAQADPADLSGGQKQRVAIASALAMRPEILLLDEPSAMLDVEGRCAIQGIIEQLSERGITIIHVTHFMDDALRADRVIVLEHGRVALDGTPDEVFAHRERIRDLGLEVPFALQLAERLCEHGFDLPMTADADELADALAPQLALHNEFADQRCAVDAGAPGTSDTTARTSLGETPANAEPRAADTEPAPAIEFEHVSFSYAHATSARKRKRRGLFGNRARAVLPDELALQDVSFSVAPGSLTALIGHTGSGKSTTVELTCALKVPLAGTVRIAGINTADMDRRRELRHAVGYVSQLPERQLFAETVREDIAFGPRNLGLPEYDVEARVREALTSVDLPTDDAFLARSPFALSGGQQRGVALAGILAMRPRIIVLDEPMAGLDPAGRAQTRSLLARLKQTGTTLLLVTHDMDDVAELADHVIALDNGRVVADGTPAEVFGAKTKAAADGAIERPAELAYHAFPSAITNEASRQTGVAAQRWDRPPVPGLPSALAFSCKLEARGVVPLHDPLTLDALVREVVHHGAAR